MPYFSKERAEIRKRIHALLSHKERVIIAIDGRCASGKTTLAKNLAHDLSVPYVSCDDFFLPLEKRTPERLAASGGNMERERLFSEVLAPFLRGDTVSYRPFICKTLSYGDSVLLPQSRILIVEGAYACHNELWDHYDLHILLTISPEEQKKRILKRNPHNANDFFTKWIPMEEGYLKKSRLIQEAEIILGSESLQ